MEPKPQEKARVVKLQIEGEQTSGAGMRDTSAQDRLLDRGRARRRQRVRWALGGLVTLVALVFLVPAASRWFETERTVARDRLQLAPVVRAPFVRDVRVQGQVVAAVSPTLFSPSKGAITLAVQAGDAVQAGQVLAVVENPELRSRLQTGRAALQGAEVARQRQEIEAKQGRLVNQQAIDLAEVRLRAAEREMRRAQDSHDHQVISQHDYERAVDEVDSARVAHRHALDDAALDRERLDFEVQTRQLELDHQDLVVKELQRQVEELTIRSPVAGLVGNLLVEQKEFVAENQPLVTVVDLSALEIEIRVPESYGDDLQTDMAVELTLGSDLYTGVLAAISPEIEDGQVAGRVRFDGEQPLGLKRNQRVSARVILDAREDVLQVRRGRFYESGGGRIGYVVTAEDRLRRRTLLTGASSIEAVEILDGLEEGETLVISDLDPFEGAETVLLVN